MLKIKIRNTFIETKNIDGNSVARSGNIDFSDLTSFKKTVNLPINLKFTPTDYEEQRQDVIDEEVRRSLNKPYDYETTKYTRDSGVKLVFKFYNGSTFVSNYSPMGYNTQTDFTKKTFKKSFFRIYFYDKLRDNESSLLFIEEILAKDTERNGEISFNLDRLYWLKNDLYFLRNINKDREIYFDAIFFNGKTGSTHKLITHNQSTLSHNDVVNNPNLLKGKFKLLNPLNNGGFYNFTSDKNVIQLSEDIRV